MRASFTFQFLLIHHGINLEAQQDADDIIITSSMAQACFLGLLTVKTVLDHILRHEGNYIMLHPLVQTLE